MGFAARHPSYFEPASLKPVHQNLEATCTSHTPAPEITATVAPFRAWRGLQLIVAGEPMQVTIEAAIIPALLRAFNLHPPCIQSIDPATALG